MASQLQTLILGFRINSGINNLLLQCMDKKLVALIERSHNIVDCYQYYYFISMHACKLAEEVVIELLEYSSIVILEWYVC